MAFDLAVENLLANTFALDGARAWSVTSLGPLVDFKSTINLTSG